LAGKVKTWFIPFADKRVDVRSLTTSAIPQRFCDEAASHRRAITHVSYILPLLTTQTTKKQKTQNLGSAALYNIQPARNWNGFTATLPKPTQREH